MDTRDTVVWRGREWKWALDAAGIETLLTAGVCTSLVGPGRNNDNSVQKATAGGRVIYGAALTITGSVPRRGSRVSPSLKSPCGIQACLCRVCGLRKEKRVDPPNTGTKGVRWSRADVKRRVTFHSCSLLCEFRLKMLQRA